jgi:hypothetical protein
MARLPDADPVHAMAKLEEALQLFARLGARFEKARTRLQLARIAHAIGSGAGAREHAAAALEACRAIGAWKYAREAEALAATLPGR